MFSFNHIKETSRTFGSIVDDSTKEVKEILYITNQSKKDPISQDEADEFKNQLKPYIDEDKDVDEKIPGKVSSVTEVKLKSKYTFNILPNSDICDKFMREIIYVNGSSGSGKSWQICNYVLNYHLFYPDNKIYYISCNKIENDPSLKKIEILKRILEDGTSIPVVQQFDLKTIESAIKFEKFKDTLFIFDDVIDMKIPIDHEDMLQMLNDDEREKYSQKTNIKDKRALDSFIRAKSNQIMLYVKESILNILLGGRKNHLSAIVVDHKLKSGLYSCQILAQTTSVILYPYNNNSKEKMAEFLTEKLGFSKADAKYVNDIDFEEFEYLYINCGKRFIMTPNLLKLF